jgi:hypothetical protein
MSTKVEKISYVPYVFAALLCGLTIAFFALMLATLASPGYDIRGDINYLFGTHIHIINHPEDYIGHSAFPLGWVIALGINGVALYIGFACRKADIKLATDEALREEKTASRLGRL